MNETLTCSFLDIDLDQTIDTHTANFATCVLNSIFSLITITGNFIILNAIWKNRELHSPSFVLLFFLALSDLLVGLICQPSFVAFKIAELRRDFSCYCISRMIQSISGWTTSGVSLLTLSAVSLDRLLSLTLHLRYNTIVTVPRAFVACVFLWFFAVTGMMLRFTMTNWIILPLIILLTTFLVTALSTLKIFMIVRRHLCQIKQLQRNLNTSQTETVQVLKCRKSVVTVLYVYGLFWIFYVPFCVTMLMDSAEGYTLTVKIVYDYVGTIVFLNSFFNPIVYCWRIREIRNAVKSLLRKRVLLENNTRGK